MKFQDPYEKTNQDDSWKVINRVFFVVRVISLQIPWSSPWVFLKNTCFSSVPGGCMEKPTTNFYLVIAPKRSHQLMGKLLLWGLVVLDSWDFTKDRYLGLIPRTPRYQQFTWSQPPSMASTAPPAKSKGHTPRESEKIPGFTPWMAFPKRCQVTKKVFNFGFVIITVLFSFLRWHVIFSLCLLRSAQGVHGRTWGAKCSWICSLCCRWGISDSFALSDLECQELEMKLKHIQCSRRNKTSQSSRSARSSSPWGGSPECDAPPMSQGSFAEDYEVLLILAEGPQAQGFFEVKVLAYKVCPQTIAKDFHG